MHRIRGLDQRLYRVGASYCQIYLQNKLEIENQPYKVPIEVELESQIPEQSLNHSNTEREVRNLSQQDAALMLGELDQEGKKYAQQINQLNPQLSNQMNQFLRQSRGLNQNPLDRVLSLSTNIDPNLAWQLCQYGDHHIVSAVQYVCGEKGISSKWSSLLKKLATHAVQNVKTSSRLLSDTMRLNNYIKIKCIPWKDSSKSQYIHGVMFTKNVADRRMASKISNPRILLISSPLQFYARPDDRKTYAAIDSLISQQSFYLDILLRKIKLVKPNIILTQSNASRSVLDTLRKQGITVVTNVKRGIMDFLARCTQTIILPSINLIDKSVVLGTCNKFEVIRHNNSQIYTQNYNQTLIESMNKQSILSDISQSQNSQQVCYSNIVRIDHSQMMFQGCNPVLGCTLCLSGPNIQELKQVKKALREIIVKARNVILERGYLIQCGLQYPNYFMIEDDEDEDEGSSNFRSSQNSIDNFSLSGNPDEDHQFKLNQHQFLKISKKKRVLRTEYSPYLGKNFGLLSNKQILYSFVRMSLGAAGRQQILSTQESYQNENMLKFNEKRKHIKPHKVVPLNFSKQIATMQTGNQLTESKIKQQLDKVCGRPIMDRLNFYQGNDKPLGVFISDLIGSAFQRCQTCKRLNFMHYFCFYMLDGRIRISLNVLKTVQQQEQSKSVKGSNNMFQQEGSVVSSEAKAIQTIKRIGLVNIGPRKGKFISKEGRITSTALQAGREARQATFREPIITYCYCRLCKRRVSAKEPMNNDYYEYSFSCFMLQYFLNEKIITRGRYQNDNCALNCGHPGH